MLIFQKQSIKWITSSNTDTESERRYQSSMLEMKWGHISMDPVAIRKIML